MHHVFPSVMSHSSSLPTDQFHELIKYGHNDDENPVKITLTMLDVVLVISTLLYLFCLIIAKRKIMRLHAINRSLGLKKLLVLSVLIVCAIRIMTFVGVTCMDVANVRAHYSPSPTATFFPDNDNDDKHDQTNTAESESSQLENSNSRSNENEKQNFYDASMAILWDLPNTIVVSTYILLTLVWSECFMQSRLHTENTIKWKRRWMLGYTIFNSCLYFTQLTLYILVIVDGSNFVKNILYAAMTGTNFCAVSLVAFLYFYLNIQFAGFPTRSPQARKSLMKISRLMALWTLSRVLWAIVMLIVYVCGIDLLHFSSSLLFFLFVICEIMPIIAMLDYSYMEIMRFEGDSDTLEVSDLVEQEFNTGEGFLRGGTSNADSLDEEVSNWLGDLDDIFGETSSIERTRACEEPLLLQV